MEQTGSILHSRIEAFIACSIQTYYILCWKQLSINPVNFVKTNLFEIKFGLKPKYEFLSWLISHQGQLNVLFTSSNGTDLGKIRKSEKFSYSCLVYSELLSQSEIRWLIKLFIVPHSAVSLQKRVFCKSTRLKPLKPSLIGLGITFTWEYRGFCVIPGMLFLFILPHKWLGRKH